MFLLEIGLTRTTNIPACFRHSWEIHTQDPVGFNRGPVPLRIAKRFPRCGLSPPCASGWSSAMRPGSPRRRSMSWRGIAPRYVSRTRRGESNRYGAPQTGVLCGSTKARALKRRGISATSWGDGSRGSPRHGPAMPTCTCTSTTTRRAMPSGTQWPLPSWPRPRASVRRAYLQLTPLEGYVGIVGRDVATAKIAERETIARRLGRRAFAQNLVQIPVHPFVAVEEPQHIAAAAEEDRL